VYKNIVTFDWMELVKMKINLPVTINVTTGLFKMTVGVLATCHAQYT